MTVRANRGFLSRVLGKRGDVSSAPRSRRIGFEPLETRCLLSVSPALPEDPVADVTSAGSAEVGDVFVITSGDIVDYSNDPLAEVLDTNLVRLFREYEAWVGPGDFEPSNLSWAIEGGAVKVVIYGTKGTLDGVEEAVKERLGLDIDRFVTYKSAGKATVPFDLLDDLAGIDDIRSVAAISPMVTGPVNPSDIMPVDAVVLAPVAVADPLDGAYSAELEEFATSPLSTKTGSDLFMLQKEYEAYKSDSKGGTFDANRPAMVMVGEEVVVTVTFDVLRSGKADISAEMHQHALKLSELGFTVQHTAGPSVIGSVSPDLLDDIASLDGVISLRASHVYTRAGVVTSQGDQAQGSDAARTTYGIDGSGVQVNVVPGGVAAGGDKASAGDDGTGGLLEAVAAGESIRQDISRPWDSTGSERLNASLGGAVATPNISKDTDMGGLDLLHQMICWETISARDHSSTTKTTSITGVIPSLILDGWWDGIES